MILGVPFPLRTFPDSMIHSGTLNCHGRKLKLGSGNASLHNSLLKEEVRVLSAVMVAWHDTAAGMAFSSLFHLS